jgi:hypothetical protein
MIWYTVIFFLSQPLPPFRMEFPAVRLDGGPERRREAENTIITERTQESGDLQSTLFSSLWEEKKQETICPLKLLYRKKGYLPWERRALRTNKKAWQRRFLAWGSQKKKLSLTKKILRKTIFVWGIQEKNFFAWGSKEEKLFLLKEVRRRSSLFLRKYRRDVSFSEEVQRKRNKEERLSWGSTNEALSCVSKPGRKDSGPEDARKKSFSHMRKYGGETFFRKEARKRRIPCLRMQRRKAFLTWGNALFLEEARKRRFPCLRTCGREAFFLWRSKEEKIPCLKKQGRELSLPLETKEIIPSFRGKDEQLFLHREARREDFLLWGSTQERLSLLLEVRKRSLPFQSRQGRKDSLPEEQGREAEELRKNS